MPKPGQITAVSAGTLQQVFRPQIRIYYHNEKYGILCETLEKPLRCRSRKRAVELAKIWIGSEDGQRAIKQKQYEIAANPENRIK